MRALRVLGSKSYAAAGGARRVLCGPLAGVVLMVFTLGSCGTSGTLEEAIPSEDKGDSVKEDTEAKEGGLGEGVIEAGAGTNMSAPMDEGILIGAQGIPAPDWVYEVPIAPDGLYATGYAKATSTPISLKAAAAAARSSLLERARRSFEVTLGRALARVASSVGESEKAIYIEESSKKAPSVLQGSTVAAHWIAPDGTAYILMYLPYSYATMALSDIVQSTAAARKLGGATKIAIQESDWGL